MLWDKHVGGNRLSEPYCSKKKHTHTRLLTKSETCKFKYMDCMTFGCTVKAGKGRQYGRAWWKQLIRIMIFFSFEMFSLRPLLSTWGSCGATHNSMFALPPWTNSVGQVHFACANSPQECKRSVEASLIHFFEYPLQPPSFTHPPLVASLPVFVYFCVSLPLYIPAAKIRWRAAGGGKKDS